MADPPEGCPFRPRCAFAGDDCRVMPPLDAVRRRTAPAPATARVEEVAA